MTVEGLPAPLADSRDISYWFCEVYPKLLPEQHRAKIIGYMTRIHEIEGISVSANRPAEPEKDFRDPACGRILARTDISPEYRKAVEFKDSVYVTPHPSPALPCPALPYLRPSFPPSYARGAASLT